MWGKTRSHDEETREKISKTKKNAKLLSPLKGIPRSEETKRKIKEKMKLVWKKRKNEN